MKALKYLAALVLGLGLISGGTSSADEMTMMVFNVGKADCILLRSGKSAYLIDTAKGKHSDLVEEGLKTLGVKHLDAVIITHMDSDHVGGLKKLLKSDLPIDHIYIPAFFCPEEDSDQENPAVKAAAKQGREAELLQSGDELPLDGGVLKVLGPIRAATDKDDNNSIVLWAEAAGGSILLAGDMEFPEEADLLQAGAVPRADVLKVGNHGDNDATSEAFLEAVRPKIAVISTSTEEKESTPAPRTLRALARWNAEVYQTQEAELGILVTVRNGEIAAERKDSLD